MSNLLEQASLVLIPSGYKEDVVYSQIPLDGSGDLQLTRASDGTRVNSAGLVEVVSWNLLQESKTFSNAVWTKQDSSITANATTAPNGTLTADKLVENTSTSAHSVWQANNLPNQTYTYSFYAKASERVWVYTRGDIGLNYFNVSTGVVGTTSAGATSTIENVGNGWYRCIVTKTFHPQFNTQIAISTADNIDSYTGNGTSGIFLWGAQLNIGATAKPYFPTTDRLNVPRLTYQNGGGGCPSLLLEKQSTNLVSYSQGLTGASWTTVANTLTANYATSPDGTSNATRIIPTTANSTHINFQTFTVSSATSITAFAKADGYNFFQIYGGDASGGPLRYSVVVNLTTGAIDTIDTITSNQVAIVLMGNGWYKITISNFTSFTSGFSFVGIAGIPSSGLSRNANFDVIFAGNGTGGVLAYGIQVEESTYPTSYIPTTSASATRVADACSKTGISSLIGQTEGVIFADVYLDSRSNYTYFAIAPNLGSTTAYIGIGFEATRINFEVVNSGIQASIPFVNSSTGRFKIAAAYKQNDFAFYVNGTQIGTDTSGTVPTCSEFGLTAYSQSASVYYNQVALFPTRLTNAELASLTTL
jgi:hypothetical protein